MNITIGKEKLNSRLALESLMRLCQDEIRNLERFEDERMLIATYNLRISYKGVVETAERLKAAFERMRLIEGDPRHDALDGHCREGCSCLVDFEEAP